MTNYTKFSYPVVLISPYRFYENVPPIFLEVSHLLIALRCLLGLLLWFGNCQS